jgi:beta-mannosidase
MKKRMTLSWRTGFSEEAQQAPAEWVPAKVPGAVQLDWAAAAGWPEWFVGEEHRKYRWMEKKFWRYETVLPYFTLNSGEQVYFCCDGIDYSWEIMVDGQSLLRHEGMFSPARLNLTGKVRTGSVLTVTIRPAPSREDAPSGRDEADHSVKPPVSYGWDWHPRLVPLGIWENAWLEIRSERHLVDVDIEAVLAADNQSAELLLAATLAGVDPQSPQAEQEGRPEREPQDQGQLRWVLNGPDGNTVWEESFPVTATVMKTRKVLNAPVLWWPNGHGDQAMYTSRVEWVTENGAVLDTTGRRLGIRRVRLVMHPDAWREPSRFPKTRSVPPITLEINGRPIFAKGSNWLNPDVFPGAVDQATYEPLIQAAREAHFNIFRCWGGAFVDKEAFFSLCDDAGILVWQEFPLACNRYPDDPAYLAVLDAESRAIIRRLRRHPCLAIWCGGNELFNEWSGMTDQSLALRLLNRNTYELDPHTPFLPTSPVMGMAHGGYSFVDPQTGEEIFQSLPQAENTAYTEFGISGPSPEPVLRKFLKEEELFPPRPDTPWGSHNGLGDGEPWSAAWLSLPLMESYFGPMASLEQMIACGGWLQEEGYRFFFEEARRQSPRCAMAINWAYNDCWTQAANATLLAWGGVRKAGYGGAKSACRPVLASLANQRFAWEPGELFQSTLWLLNDSPEALEAGTIHVRIEIGEYRVSLGRWIHEPLAPWSNRKGLTVSAMLPADLPVGQPLLVHAEYEGRREWSSVYRLLLGRGAGPTA